MMFPELIIAELWARALYARLIKDRGERGEITTTTIVIAGLAALALAVVAIITIKILSKAESIPTN